LVKGLRPLPLPFPYTIGFDLAGQIESVGEGVTTFSPGDRVFSVNWGYGKPDDDATPVGGAFAEYVHISAAKISKIPSEVSYDEAAAVALAGCTAHQIMNEVLYTQLINLHPQTHNHNDPFG
jgi:NADPH:quinone reductase